jgi:hypothetical protein
MRINSYKSSVFQRQVKATFIDSIFLPDFANAVKLSMSTYGYHTVTVSVIGFSSNTVCAIQYSKQEFNAGESKCSAE